MYCDDYPTRDFVEFNAEVNVALVKEEATFESKDYAGGYYDRYGDYLRPVFTGDPGEEYGRQHLSVVDMLAEYRELLKEKIDALSAKKLTYAEGQLLRTLKDHFDDATGWKEEVTVEEY